MNLMPLDELNALTSQFRLLSQELRVDIADYEDDIIDEMFELYVLAYLSGADAANQMLGENRKADITEMEAAIFRKFEGEDYRARVREHIKQNDVSGVIRVAETDTERIYNTAVYDMGASSPRRVLKTWNTQEDNRVRDTHSYLQGRTLDANERFYTWDGDSARYPGDFELASNNVNCRCYITLTPD